MTIVKFTQHSGYTYYYTDWNGDMSGEYVPLAEYQELENKLAQATHILAQREVNKLQALIQRVVDIGPYIYDEISMDYEEKTPKLKQLLRDCKEVLK